MAWRKASTEKSELLDKAMASFNCQFRKMFGYPAYFVNGHMLAGMHEDNIILRLSDADREKVLAAFADAVQFEPMPGRPMREYLVLPESLYGDPNVFEKWLDSAFSYASSLPPKEAKPKKKR